METGQMKIGVQLPEVEYEIAWPELLRMARTAEAVGFDSIWLGDHLLYDLPGIGARGPWEVWTSLAAIAAVTTRVEIGPLVACTGFHAPAMLAKLAATVDGISGGRLVLGLGAGWNRREFDAFGFPYDHRVERFEESFAIIRELLRTGRSSFAGRHHSVDDAVLHPGPVRPGGPPILLGSWRPRMLSIAGPHIDAWNIWWSDFGNTPDGFAQHKERVDETLSGIGRRPGEVAATAAVLVQLPGGAGRTMGDYPGGPIEPLRGTPLEFAEQLMAFARVGVSHLQLVVDPITTASLELLAPVLETLRSMT
jgi:alkanesulfonate monooxygenase SsuD/methylene tetrahydromethanopterin reductase-like flavin-dependent oxidoreductase (luciferase family)